ncbi:bifunctional 3-(3-hydroxy-phenyl)propionate/3-hydroxycinnamic acid hydroxylase [Streptomyces cinereospinus]|uniref:Bifunctional 3-(3-hydroxy-phenyl)propionate/3-hydroxycinnamic acid hydroxylase n=1 Tax=Streptomyces cinereospinus TaxID=285561 RepID=A0ABV5NBL3_9ACTN
MSVTLDPDATAMPESISCDVAIVGYGPVGMVLSGLLAQRGFDVVVVERHHTLYPLARAGHLDGETMRVFQELGVANEVELVAQPMLMWNLVTPEMEVLSTIHIGEGGAGWKESYLSYQPEIDRILDARVRELGVRVITGVNAERVDQSEDRASVTCRSVDDRTAAPTVIDAAFVIGADGANSFVRSALGIERAELGYAPMDSLVIDFKLDDPDRELELMPEVIQVLDPERPQLAGRWEGRNYMRFEFILHDGEDPVEFAQEDNCWKLLEMWNLSPEDGHIERNVVYRFEATLAPQWREGRVLFAGDAAHTMPPTMGQGMCSGIRDAANLVWKLDAVLRGGADQALLDTFQSERSAHVLRLIEMCVGMGDMWNSRDPEEVHRRDQMLRMGNVPPAPAFPRLGTGLVVPESDESLLVDGRPSPQARVAYDGRVDRLDEFGAGWKIVSRHAVAKDLFTEVQLKALKELDVEFAHVSRGPGPGYYVDLDGEYDLWFRKHGVRAFIQRPDKYVFGAVAELDELPALVDRLIGSLTEAGWTFRTVDTSSIKARRSPAAAIGSDPVRASLPYPGDVDVRYAGDAAVEFFTSFFTAKTKRQINETHAHFHPDQTYYADATLGWQFRTNAELEGMWKKYMPFWSRSARSYPVQIIGDTTAGAVVMMMDSPELFGGEIRAIAIVDFTDGKITRFIDYWDGRGFGAAAVEKLRLSAEQFPTTLKADLVEPKHSPVLGAAVEGLMAAISSGAGPELKDLLAYDVTLEDFALRSKIRGRAAVARYLGRAAGRLPYQGAMLSHIVGTQQGGGFEWTADGTDVPRGAAAVTLDHDGKINSLSFCWDGSLIDDQQISTLVALAVEPRR